MNEKEIGEIRRRVRCDRSNMTAIYGCYVNMEKEVVSEFKLSTGIMSENEAEKYFSTLRKVLTGGVGKNLIDISFKTSQVQDSPEHRLLMSLRNSELCDAEVRNAFYQKVIESVDLHEAYLILLGHERYDVPFKNTFGDENEGGDEVYAYIMCAICPVKLSKSTLLYIPDEKVFHDGGTNNVVSAPELGFLFPAFDSRSSNIYNALFYTRSSKENHESFVDTVFKTKIQKPAAEQKKSFEALLGNSLAEECSLDVLQTVHHELCTCIDMHKESKIAEPLLITKEQVKDALKLCGVPEKNVAKFSVEYDEVFGADAELHPKNIINHKRFDITTPDISIKVNPERSDLIETRVIGGVKYILICANENVEVNGIPIQIANEK